MSPPPAAPAAVLRQALLNVCQRVTTAREQLSRLDAVAGDGDLGENLAIGFAALAGRLSGDQPGAEALSSVGSLLTVAGGVLARAAPSSFGTLLGLGLRDAGKVTLDQPELTPSGLVAVLDAVAEGVARRGQAVPGQRTVLDAIVAARDAAALRAGDASAGIVDALGAAAAGAQQGAEATASMLPQVGRAGWIGARAVGHADAGATAFAVIVAALHEGVAADSEDSHATRPR